MQRKIVKHGESTLTISLPSKWVRANNIKNGQIIDIESLKDKLVLSINDPHFEKIDLSFKQEEEWFVHKILRHLYTTGYDEINVRYEKLNQLKIISKGIEILPGMEVIESSDDGCRLKCIASSTESEYGQLVKNVLWSILAQIDSFIGYCENKKSKEITEFGDRFYVFSKLINLCKRLLNKKNIHGSKHTIYAYDFLNALIEISLLISYSYDYLKDKKEFSLTEEETDFIKKTREFYYCLLQAYQNININKTKEFFEERRRMFDENKALELMKGKNPVIVHYFLMILRTLTPIGNHILMLYPTSTIMP